MIPVDHWAFGWDALVAIGTLALACGTVILAVLTYFVSRATRAVAEATMTEIQADWRPVLLIEPLRRGRDGRIEPALILSDTVFEILVTNCGRGPALDVTAEIWLEEDKPRAEPTRIAIASGGSATLYWTAEGQLFETFDITQIGRLSYADLSYAGYQTSFVIKTESHGFPSIDWQRVDGDPAYQAPLYGP